MMKPILLFSALCLGLAEISNAAMISTVIAYGDSLSDNGNFFKATGSPPAPYFAGRFSNGPVAVEGLAKILGTPLLDFAWGGATTGIGNYLDPGGTATSVGINGLPGMTTLFAGTLASITPLATNALFIVWGGPNDFLSPSPMDASAIATANRAVSNLIGIVNGLKGAGAQNILVPGMPDLGLTPYFMGLGAAAAGQATALTNYFDAQLMAQLPSGATYFDTAGLLRKIVGNPAAYGFTNVTEACFNATAGTLCSNPNQYLFWDDFHPTGQGHAILAADLANTVPEPSTWILFASSFSLLAFSRWRRGVRLAWLFRSKMASMMDIKYRCGTVQILLLLVLLSGGLSAAPRQLRWTELEPAIVGEQIRVVLPNSQVVEGKALSIDADALVMEVRRTSNETLYPKIARYSVPRLSLQALQVRRMTARGRIIGTTVGTVAGLGFAVAASLRASGGSFDLFASKTEPKPASAALWSTVAVGLPVGGYFLGRAADKHTTDITILSDETK